MAHIERSHLTSRSFNGRQVRKTLAFYKDIDKPSCFLYPF